MNCYLAMASEDIDCVIFANLVKVNDVPEIPTHDEITPSDRCDGDVQRICQRIPGNDTKFEIRCLKLQGLNGDLLNAGCLVVRCKKFLDDVGGRSLGQTSRHLLLQKNLLLGAENSASKTPPKTDVSA